MARHESDREDLLAETVALVRRVELQVAGAAEPVVAGVRDNDRLSIYFGSEPVYHFDEAGRLRRAFAHGRLFRTQGTTLARMNRVRTDSATVLHRHDLSDSELADFLDNMKTRLTELLNALQSKNAKVLRCVPFDFDFRPELSTRIQQILQTEPPLAEEIRGKS